MPRAPEPHVATLRRPGPGSAGATLSLRDEDFGGRAGAAQEDLRRRLDGWARAVASRLRAFGLELAVCIVDEAGGSCALFLACGASGHGHETGASAGAGAGSDDARAALVLGVGTAHVRAGLELPPAQASAVGARFSDLERALELSAALEALPEQFSVGLDGDEGPLQAPRCDAKELRTILGRGAEEGRPAWIGWTVPRALALEHAVLLDEQLEDALVALARIYVLLAGELASETEGGGVRRTKRAAGRSGARSKRVAPGFGDDERERGPLGSAAKQSRRAPPGSRDDRRAGRDGEVEADHEPEPERPVEVVARSARVADARLPSRARLRHRPAPPIERGARVRVLEGPFAGKVGVVHELDGKGGARVMLGLLAVRLDVKNLTANPEGRYRPVLSSSHRKAMPVRS